MVRSSGQSLNADPMFPAEIRSPPPPHPFSHCIVVLSFRSSPFLTALRLRCVTEIHRTEYMISSLIQPSLLTTGNARSGPRVLPLVPVMGPVRRVKPAKRTPPPALRHVELARLWRQLDHTATYGHGSRPCCRARRRRGSASRLALGPGLSSLARAGGGWRGGRGGLVG